MSFSICQFRSALVLGTCSVAAVLLSGCSTNSFLSSGPEPLAVTHRMHGTVHGGQQPVSGATVTLNTVGTTGYGSAGTVLATTTTNATGGFDFGTAFTCPATPTGTYILATGGNPGLSDPATNNTKITLVAATGDCASLGAATVVSLNEVTTVAAAFSLGQYFSATADSFGAPATTQATVGIVNAMSTVNNLVSLSTGAAVNPSVTRTGTPGTITAIPEFAKVNTIADILAACVNTDGGTSSPCATIFADVTPAGGTAPTDTLQAAVLFSLNPTSTNAKSSATNIAELYSYVPGVAAFMPTLAAAPGDWTVGIQYTAGTSTTQTLINGANSVAIDSGGNVWIINYNTAATATESLAEFSPTGVPLANPFNSGAAAPASFAAVSPRQLAIDINNNVFVSSSSGSAYVFKYSSAGATSSLSLGSQPYGLAIDGNNNVFVSHNSGTIGIDEFPGGTLASTNRVEYPLNNSTSFTQYAAFNSAGALFLTSGTGTSQVLSATGFNPSTCTAYPCTSTNDTSLTATYSTVTAGSPNFPFGIAAAASGAGYFANQTGNTLGYFTAATTGSTYGSSTSLFTPRAVTVDGSNTAWIANRGNGSISEITSAGTILSPVSSIANSVGFVHVGIGSPTGIAVDPSGNVWVSDGTTTVGNATTNSIFELVGAAAPAVTPLALAVKNASFGSKP